MEIYGFIFEKLNAYVSVFSTLGLQNDSSYSYTTFVDPANTQLLCVATQSTQILNVKWMGGGVTEHENPIILNTLHDFNDTLTCDTGNAHSVTVSLTVEGITMG